MIDLPASLLRLLHALATAPSAWRTPGELAEAIGEDVEATTDHLASLDESGWVEVWERPEGLALTLSALAAERMSLKLVEFGQDEALRWAPTGDPEPPAPRARNVCNSARAADLNFVVDPRELPEIAVERAEMGLIRAEVKGPGALPRPTTIVGQAVSPWREVVPGRACPGCGGLRLGPTAYCLCCGRWGLDARLFGAGAPSPRPESARNAAFPESSDPRRNEDALRSQRMRRKLRRMSKLTARASAEAGPRPRRPPFASRIRPAIKAAATAPS